MTDDIAVKVENVSKVFYIWKKPRDKLFFFLKSILGKVWPVNKSATHHDTNDCYLFHALRDISFTIKKGESWGFIGLNGSGKSTLLKIISGNLKLSSGRVEVDGKVVILNYGNGFNGDFTGKENIFIKAGILGLTKKQIQARWDSIIEFAEIGDFINQPVKTYSSGMISRLDFAIIAHVDADIIITDEALAVGDVFFVQKCMRFIRAFLKTGTFLFVSHSINDVLSLCQHAVWLEHGVIKAIGSAANISQAYLDQIVYSQDQDLVLEKNKKNTTSTVTSIMTNVVPEISIEQPYISKLMDYQYAGCADFNSAWSNRIDIQAASLVEDEHYKIAKVLKVAFHNTQGALSTCYGGEPVTLVISIRTYEELVSPIIGFQTLNNEGQIIFADNTSLLTKNQPVCIKAGTLFTTEFSFNMPFLATGIYSFRIAIAIGEEENAVFLQTINTALQLHSVTLDPRPGLLGIPMTVKINTCDLANAI